MARIERIAATCPHCFALLQGVVPSWRHMPRSADQLDFYRDSTIAFHVADGKCELHSGVCALGCCDGSGWLELWYDMPDQGIGWRPGRTACNCLAVFVDDHPTSAVTTGADTPNAEVRDWARRNGFDVGLRGRLGAAVVDAFRAAHAPLGAEILGAGEVQR